jgi:hypothetical protein
MIRGVRTGVQTAGGVGAGAASGAFWDGEPHAARLAAASPRQVVRGLPVPGVRPDNGSVDPTGDQTLPDEAARGEPEEDDEAGLRFADPYWDDAFCAWWDPRLRTCC